MNIDNRLRLITMRKTNPNDTIYLIYDSRLLTNDAHKALKLFCQTYQINPKDMLEDIIPQCTTQEEYHLIAVYQDEIMHLQEGGNLAAAKDIVSWLKPIYSLGTYSDFDVTINTNELEDSILVVSPLLLAIGSISQTHDGDCYDTLCLNNDIVAVVDSDAALPLIQQVQRAIFNACTTTNPFSFSDTSIFKNKDINPVIALTNGIKILNAELKAKYLHVLHETYATGNTVRKIRHLIMTHAHDDNESTELLVTSIIYTSGPNLIMNTLFPNKVYLEDDFNKVKTFSFNFYGLDQSFSSAGCIPLHTTSIELLQIHNDASFTPLGEKRITNREAELTNTAIYIQRLLRRKHKLHYMPQAITKVDATINTQPNTSLSNYTKTYAYNPHNHVKIRLSDKPDVFLKNTEQLDLIRLRSTNPTDAIYLIYDRTLLTEQANEDLSLFCKKYQIVCKDMLVDIIKQCTTEEECNLIQLYYDEIHHLNKGGDLAVASNIIRWLQPIYSLGTYSHFGVTINTQDLPETIQVLSPLLLGIGSQNFARAHAEFVSLNDDVFAVVDLKEALPLIQNIQQAIYRDCSDTNALAGVSVFKNKIKNKSVFLNGQECWMREPLEPYLGIVHKVVIPGKTARGIRESILNHHVDAMSYCKFIMKLTGFDNFPCTDELVNQIAKDLLAQSDYRKDYSCHTVFFEKARECSATHLLYCNSKYTSGSMNILTTLFPERVYDSSYFNRIIKPSAFSTYGLDKHFISPNVMTMHTSSHDILKQNEAINLTTLHDLKHTPAGKNAIKAYEDSLEKAAIRIQGFFRRSKDKSQESTKHKSFVI